MKTIFNSRDKKFRSSFGAQPKGTEIHFRICLPRNLVCSAAYLSMKTSPVFGDVDIISEQENMFWAGMEGDDHEWWECHYTLPEVGIYWYQFEIRTHFGTRYLSTKVDGSAELSQNSYGARWQITCYHPDFKTPEWLVGGVMYQIFPDRFAFSGEKKENVPSDRIIRKNWDEDPTWKPNEEGKVSNNDYFQGDLLGIEEKLDYLSDLGVTCIYLNPIFEAHTSHRYDTADYSKIDPLLGTEEDFQRLVKTANQIGIKIMIDGVFSHTGSDSIYFNREGRYDSVGAFQSKESPFYPWYDFQKWPNKYTSWWGFETLPEIDEFNKNFREYINGEDGIIGKRVKDGIGGWRLDVADELPDEFLDELRVAVKKENPDALVLGEVWEDASRKYAYGINRRYFLGDQLDSVMNYPFRTAILELVRGKGEELAQFFIDTVMGILENYPPQVVRILMNHIGTHDTERAITMLVGERLSSRDRQWQDSQKLSPEQKERGVKLLKLASLLQYMLPGVPCIYYGDEACMEGYRDPFNRHTYPWGEEDKELISWYRQLGKLRKSSHALREGEFVPVYAEGQVVVFERKDNEARLICGVNPSDSEVSLKIDEEFKGATICFGNGKIDKDGILTLPAMDCGVCVI